MSHRCKFYPHRPDLLLVFLFVLCWAPAAFGAEAQETLNGYLERLARATKETSYIKSDFVQTKVITFMDEQLVSEGFFIFKAPLELEWEYTKPVASGLIYKNGKASLWYAPQSGSNAGAAARENVSSHSGSPENVIAKVIAEHLITWTNLDIDVLKKNYTIRLMSEAPLTIMLTPSIRIPGSPVNEFKVIFDSNNVDVKQLYLYEADEDYTKIDFYNLIRK